MITELGLLLAAFFWGATFVVVKSALDDVSPILFLAVRFLLAGAALLAIYGRRIRRVPQPGPGGVRGAVLAGVFLFGGYVFQTLGLRLTSASKTAFLTGLCTVMVPLLNGVIYQVRPRVVELAGVAIAMTGMALMTLERFDLVMQAGDMLTIAGAVFFALHYVTVGHYAKQIGFERLTVIQILTASALGFLTFWWAEDSFVQWSPQVLWALVITSLLATAVAFSIVAWAQQRLSATRVALILLMELVFAWATSFVLLGEVLEARVAAGAVLILAGIIVVEWKPAMNGEQV